MEITNNFENKLLKRNEVVGTISTDGATPSRLSIKSELAKKLKAKEELVVVKKVETGFGSRSVKFEANVYADAKTLEALTAKHIQKRNEAPKAEESEE